MLATKLEVVSNNGARNPTYNSIKRFTVDGLGDLIRVLMENVDDALFQLSDKVDNDRERNMYFEAMREIRLRRDALKRQFDVEMQQCFDRVLLGKKGNDAEEDDTELTLIEYDDLEDSIAIRNMIARARPQFEDELFAVSERLKLVLKRDSLEADDNPLDPQAICDCFHNASELLETDIQVKLIFYKLFERYVIANLGHFYHEVNDLFVKKGVLPGFKADQERMKQTTRFMANRIRNSAAAQVGNDQPPSGLIANSAGTATEANLFAALQQAVGGNVQQGNYAPASGNYFSSLDFASELSNLQGVALANQPVATIQPQDMRAATQQQLLAFRQQNQHQINGNDNQTIDVVSMLFDFFFDDDTLPAPIKVLIGRLQIPMLKVAIIDKDFFNQKKHPARKLLDSISRAALGWSDNPAEEQALIDKTEEVVNFLINEFDDDIGVFEEAYINFENFLQRQESESDKALQALTRKEQEKDQQIEAARAAAEKLIAKLTRNRELSFDVVDFLETTWTSVLFNAYLSLGESSNHWRNLKRISTTFVWTLIPKHSEEERSKIIKTIPALLRALSKGMDLVNIKAEVQNRIFKVLASEHARVVKLTSKNIVTRVDDQTVWPEDDGAGAFARAQGIDPVEPPDLEFTTDAAGEIQIVENEVDDDSITIISAAPADAVIDDLNQFTVGVKKGRIKVAEEIVMESADGDDFDLIDSDENHLKQAQAMEIGSWVEFIESPSKVLIARLSWKSNVTGNLVFVNRQGHKVRNLTIHGFAMELRAGRAKHVESSSVFDRAIHTIMSKMQH
jgi:tetratricopeptide (TPR) repeat protein